MAALLLLLVAPLAAAHVDHARPALQEAQEARSVHATLSGPNATVELLRASDPVSDYVRHVLDARRGVVLAEYRPQASDAGGAFYARCVLARIVEYRDQNRDGAYSPGVDIQVRSWAPSGYVWNVTGPQVVRVADVQAQLLRFQGNASGAPAWRMDAVLGGQPFVDEGATVRPQDAVLYVDLTNLPRRGTGNLHAIEGTVQPSPGASARLDKGDNYTAGILVEAPGRLAFLDWGAEGVVDGREQRLAADLDPPRADGSADFRIHLPLMDESLRLVMVSGVDYHKEDRRTEAVSLLGVMVVLALLALARRR